MSDTERELRFRHGAFEYQKHLCGHRSNGWQRRKFVPKKFGIAKPAGGGVTKKRVLFGKDKRFSAAFEGFGIAIQDSLASADRRRGEMANFDRDGSARGEANKVECI